MHYVKEYNFTALYIQCGLFSQACWQAIVLYYVNHLNISL